MVGKRRRGMQIKGTDQTVQPIPVISKPGPNTLQLQDPNVNMFELPRHFLLRKKRLNEQGFTVLF